MAHPIQHYRAVPRLILERLSAPESTAGAKQGAFAPLALAGQACGVTQKRAYEPLHGGRHSRAVGLGDEAGRCRRTAVTGLDGSCRSAGELRTTQFSLILPLEWIWSSFR